MFNEHSKKMYNQWLSCNWRSNWRVPLRIAYWKAFRANETYGSYQATDLASSYYAISHHRNDSWIDWQSTGSRLAGIGRGSRPRMWWAGEESIKKLTRNLYGSVRLQSKHCFTSSKPNRVYLEFSCEQSSISFELISGWTKCRIVGDIVLAAMEWKVAFEGILAMWRYTHQAHQAYYN